MLTEDGSALDALKYPVSITLTWSETNMGHELAGGNSSWCPELKSRATPSTACLHLQPGAVGGGGRAHRWVVLARAQANSKAVVKYNVNLALEGFAKHRCSVTLCATAADVMKGHREKTLALLWRVMINWQVMELIDEVSLAAEIDRIRCDEGTACALCLHGLSWPDTAFSVCSTAIRYCEGTAFALCFCCRSWLRQPPFASRCCLRYWRRDSVSSRRSSAGSASGIVDTNMYMNSGPPPAHAHKHTYTQPCTRKTHTHTHKHTHAHTRTTRHTHTHIHSPHAASSPGANHCGRRAFTPTGPAHPADKFQLLLLWCRAVCARYGVRVHNFTTSFSDGVISH